MADSNEDSDIYGICAQCGHKVEGEGTGCSAMDKVFHINCFSCFVCKVNLQGKPFYSLEGKPYCEEDYLNTLEKCCVCTRPILDRILRATGKPYHPSCFTCVVCGQSLDGIPFTVDATNQIHCIQCFHKWVFSCTFTYFRNYSFNFFFFFFINWRSCLYAGNSPRVAAFVNCPLCLSLVRMRLCE